QFPGHCAQLRPVRLRRRRGRPALAEDDAIDRGVAEETVDPLDDQRREMLDQRRMRAVDQQGEDAARLAPRGKALLFGRRHAGVAFADDLGPAADDRALDKAEAAERLPADVADELPPGPPARDAPGNFL